MSQSKRSDDAITKYNGSQSIIVVSGMNTNGFKQSPSLHTNYWIQNVNEDSQIMTNVNTITIVLGVGYIQEMYITGSIFTLFCKSKIS